jgi:TolB-like protein
MVVIALNLFMGGRVEAIESIAVLPFENLTGDDAQEYFVDGATDEVINQLCKIKAWRVISRRSVMHYKGVDKPLAEIARELNVDAVVEGTVYQTDENVRIGIKLIDVFPEEQNLWADTYDRPMTDVLIMYSEIASTIADKTQVDLTADELTRLTSASQVNPESYDNYLKGKSHWYKLTPPELTLALQYFDLALQLDPNNALAHVGISRVWGGRYQMGISLRNEAVPLAIESVEKALELDNTLAEAHYWLACTRTWYEWDWESAETEFKKALNLSPNFSDVHAFYSHFLCHMGRTDEALPYIEWAIKLNPLNPLFHSLYGIVLVYLQRFDDALAAARTALDMVPNLGVARTAIFLAYTGNGMKEELIAYHRERLAKNSELIAAFERGLEKAGYESALRATGDLRSEWFRKPGKRVRAWDICFDYLQACDYDLALEWLEKAYEDHEPNLPYIGWFIFDPLRSYPRFQELLRKMNLPVDEKE